MRTYDETSLRRLSLSDIPAFASNIDKRVLTIKSVGTISLSI